VRTQSEIERERYALKTLRGDFNMINEGGAAGDTGNITNISQRVLQAVK
jgi:hypothetical protein